MDPLFLARTERKAAERRLEIAGKKWKKDISI
jgi:hypothetical protein